MALNWGSTNDWVRIPTDSSFEDAASISLVFWFLATSQTGFRRLFRRDQPGNSTQITWSNADTNELTCETGVSDGASFRVTVGQNFATGVWNYLVYTFSTANRSRLFAGTLDTPVAACTLSSDSTTGARIADAGDAYIGNRSSGSAPFQGDIARFMWIDKELALWEMEYLRLRPENLPETKIWHEYLDTDAATYDLSGNGNGGVVNQVTLADHLPSSPLFAFEQDHSSRIITASAANPKGPLGHPFHGPFAGPIAA